MSAREWNSEKYRDVNQQGKEETSKNAQVGEQGLSVHVKLSRVVSGS